MRVNTNSSGSNIGEQGHYPFGTSWYKNSTTTKWQFTSYERDSESGLDYAIFRHDSSRLGRFMQPDPLAGTIANPQSLNRYAYVQNDPVNLIDPLGLEGVCHTASHNGNDAYPHCHASTSAEGDKESTISALFSGNRWPMFDPSASTGGDAAAAAKIQAFESRDYTQVKTRAFRLALQEECAEFIEEALLLSITGGTSFEALNQTQQETIQSLDLSAENLAQRVAAANTVGGFTHTNTNIVANVHFGSQTIRTMQRFDGLAPLQQAQVFLHEGLHLFGPPDQAIIAGLGLETREGQSASSRVQEEVERKCR